MSWLWAGVGICAGLACTVATHWFVDFSFSLASTQLPWRRADRLHSITTHAAKDTQTQTGLELSFPVQVVMLVFAVAVRHDSDIIARRVRRRVISRIEQEFRRRNKISKFVCGTSSSSLFATFDRTQRRRRRRCRRQGHGRHGRCPYSSLHNNNFTFYSSPFITNWSINGDSST